MLVFLAPFILAGLALLALPWLIHQIRRPERQELRFSSLMFLPKFKKEIIERRKIQHLLLMLLRILAFLMLVFAFSRPAMEYFAVNTSHAQLPARHLILLDTSSSMGMENRFQRAKQLARKTLGDVPPQEGVALVAFGATQRVLASPKDSRQRVRDALDGAELTHEATNYPAALQFAENLLLNEIDLEDDQPFVLHFFSDFQKTGFGENGAFQRLSNRIAFMGYDVSNSETDNLSITDAVLRPSERGLVVAGKIKNWRQIREAEVDVSLWLGGEKVDEKRVKVAPGNASRVAFLHDLPPQTDTYGRLELSNDDLAPDNRYFFVWEPPEETSILLLSDASANTSRTATWFLHKALAEAGDPSWRLTQTTTATLPNDLQAFHLLIISDLKAMDPALAQKLLAYTNAGGRILMCWNESLDHRELNRNLLKPWGWVSSSRRYQENLATRFTRLGRVDFEHPVFFPFQGARFNDFSQLRFHNSHPLTPSSEAAGNTTVLAAFSPEAGQPAQPAILETSWGKGKIILWTFSPELAWTNLPKHVKFLPLLHETTAYLCAREAPSRAFLVGDRIPLSGAQKIRNPDGSIWEPQKSGSPLFATAPGLLWVARDSQDWKPFAAVNVATAESDPQSVEVSEFTARLTGGQPRAATAGVTNAKEENKIKREYGRIFLFVLLALLVFELWYAAKCTKLGTPVRRSGTSTTAGG